MNNYKIKVNSEAESKEAQGLFFELGEKPHSDMTDRCGLVVFANGTVYVDHDYFENHYTKSYDAKEITLAELRDMVVLKRNDLNDANYIRPRDGKLYFVNSDQTRSYYIMDEEWTLTKWDEDQLQKQLKPIEKTMKKEYLFKQISGDYKLVDHDCQGRAIEIPNGATKATLCGEFLIFWKDNFLSLSTKNGDTDFTYNSQEDYCFTEYMRVYDDAKIIWKRPTQPEELPFIDDEPQILNDQYAEIEKVRQHSHYKKDVSNLEFVDVYRVLKLFDVADPCLQHAIKKLLCSGQRGAKSSDQDVQEAIDSLVRFQQMRIEDTLD